MRFFSVFIASVFCVSLLAKVSLAQTDVVDTTNADIPTQIVDSSSSITEISRSNYITGGVLGTTLGFGIGHAIQGRWLSDKGWIFTSAELVTLGVSFYYVDKQMELLSKGIGCALVGVFSFGLHGSDKCMDELVGADHREKYKTYGIISGIFYYAYLGIRIWEIVSVWNVNDKTHRVAKTKRPFLIAPMAYKDGGGLAMLMSF